MTTAPAPDATAHSGPPVLRLLDLARERQQALEAAQREARLRLIRADNPNGSACSTHPNPEWFWEPQTKREFEGAAAVCRSQCQRAAACLQEALTSGKEWGVWGGTWFTEGRPATRFHKPRTSEPDEPQAPAAETESAADEMHVTVTEHAA